MATRRLDDVIEPMDLANMRQNGVRSLDIMCLQCRHETVMNVDRCGTPAAMRSPTRATTPGRSTAGSTRRWRRTGSRTFGGN